MFKCLQLFTTFFKIGTFSFGGGYAILAMIFDDLKKFNIMTKSDFNNLVALSQMTPGPIAVNASTYIGYKVAGFWGAFFATTGVILPSFIIIFTIVAFFSRYKSSPIIEAILTGIRPASIAMIASAVIFLSEGSIFKDHILSPELFNNIFNYISIPALIIFLLTIILSRKYNIGPIVLTLAAGLVGVLVF